MNVSSPLEIPLTVLGWIAYDATWTVLSDTGLAWLPFLFLLAKTWIRSREKADDGEATMATLRVMETRTIVMFTVIVLAAQPMMTVNITGLNFSKKECAPGDPVTSTTVAGGSTGTTYDTVFTATTLGGVAAQVPVWWYGVMAISSGLTNAAIASLPCSPDLRGMQYRLDMTRIADDPELLRETSAFMRDCYFRARSRFNQTSPAFGPGTAYPAVTVEDIDWPGSWFFINVPGYYSELYAGEAIRGFAVDPNRLSDMHAIHKLGGAHPPWGYPTCIQWWNGVGGTAGLRTRMVQHIDADAWNHFKVWAASYEDGIDGVENQLLRKKLKVEMPLFQSLAIRGMPGYNSTASDLTAGVAWVGALKEKASFYPKVFMAREGVRMGQAMLLMVIYAVLPFLLVFSSYSFSKLFFFSVGVFAVKFAGFIWALCFWVDNHLIDSLQSAGMVGDATFFSVNKHVIDFVTGISYVLLPLIWVGILGWAGFSLGSDIGSLAGRLSEPATNAGASGGDTAKAAATKAVTKGAGKGRK